MNLKRLENYIENNNYNFDFATDGIGMTWGVSYIRLTIGLKSKFENLEHFFFSAVKSDKNMSSAIVGGPTWQERTDLSEWALNLEITAIKRDEIIQFIESSKKKYKKILNIGQPKILLKPLFLIHQKNIKNVFL